MFSPAKLKERVFNSAMRSLSTVLGVKYCGLTNSFEADESPYSWSIVGQMDRLREDCKHKVGEAEAVAAAANAELHLIRQDMQLLLNHFGVEIVTLTGKEIRKKKGARK